MKKAITILLTFALCLSLCACPAADTQENQVKQVHITAGKIEPGMTAKDVFVEVTIDHQPVACRVKLTGFSWDGYWDMADDEPVAEDFCVRLDVFYSLPKGCDVDHIQVTMECDGGQYDGTGSISFDKDGNVEAWSHAIYGEDPVAPADTETQPATESHVHSWTEQPLFIVSCTTDSTKTYTCGCGEKKTETVPAPGHDLKDNGKTQPTCTEPGRHTQTCKRCGAGFIDEIAATGHSWSAWMKDTGIVHKRTCSSCGAEETARHNIPSGSVTCTDCGEDIIN